MEMKEQNIRYCVSINFPELNLYGYYCERFGMTFNDIWLLIMESAEYLTQARLNIIDNDAPSNLPLALSEVDFDAISSDDWYYAEVIDGISTAIVETLLIPFDQNTLINMLKDMYINFGFVKVFYTFDDNGSYISDYEPREVIEIIYVELLHSALREFDTNIIDIVNLKLSEHKVELVNIIPDQITTNRDFHDKLMIVYDICKI